jgi:hypothetical protein
VTIENQADLDQPVIMHMSIEVSDFARRRGSELVLVPPFPIRIGQITRLAERQTPLVLGEPTYASVKLSFKLPPGAKIASPLAPTEVKDADRKVTVRDRQEKGNLVLEREIDIPAGRVEPPEYKALQAFAGRADEATMREIVITLAR